MSSALGNPSVAKPPNSAKGWDGTPYNFNDFPGHSQGCLVGGKVVNPGACSSTTDPNQKNIAPIGETGFFRWRSPPSSTSDPTFDTTSVDPVGAVNPTSFAVHESMSTNFPIIL